jgi:hypothetical protein
MSWIDQDNEARRGRNQAGDEELARHLRWLCCSAVLTLSVGIMAVATANSGNLFYFVIPFVVSCFFTAKQWMEWRGAKRWLAASSAAEESVHDTEDAFRCSFCGKAQAEVTHLISSPKGTGAAPAHICDRCVEVCNSILADVRSSNPRV